MQCTSTFIQSNAIMAHSMSANQCKRHFQHIMRLPDLHENCRSERLDLTRTHLLLDEHSLVVRAKLLGIGGGEESEEGHEGGEDDGSLADHCCWLLVKRLGWRPMDEIVIEHVKVRKSNDAF